MIHIQTLIAANKIFTSKIILNSVYLLCTCIFCMYYYTKSNSEPLVNRNITNKHLVCNLFCTTQKKHQTAFNAHPPKKKKMKTAILMKLTAAFIFME